MTTNDELATLAGDLTIRFERILRSPRARVWRAVTDEVEMRSWFPSQVEGERKVGAPLSFPFDDDGAETFTGEVVVWEPERVFAFTWNADLLRIELTALDDATTRLVFTQTLGHGTEAARTSSGWHVCLANLEAALGGRDAPAPEEWKALYLIYLERMPPPLPTVRRQLAFEWERHHFVAPAKVWASITDSRELEAWSGAPASIDLRVGGGVRLSEGPNAFDGVVVALEPERRLAHTADSSIVEWSIEQADHGGTRYVVRWLGADVDDEPAERAAGWHALLAQLDLYLASGQLVEVAPSPSTTQDYERLL